MNQIATEFTDFLDRKFEHRRSNGDNTPFPGRLRLTGDLTPGRAYENVQDFCGATANLAVDHNVELEGTGGVWLPVDPLWGLLALRRFELEHVGQAGD